MAGEGEGEGENLEEVLPGEYGEEARVNEGVEWHFWYEGR